MGTPPASMPRMTRWTSWTLYHLHQKWPNLNILIREATKSTPIYTQRPPPPPPPTLPIHLGASQAPSTVHSSEFLPYARTKMTGSYAQRFVSKDYRHAVTRVTRTNLYFTKP